MDKRVKTVTAAQMRAIDASAIEEYGIPSLLLMESAGSGVADLACVMARELQIQGPRFAVLCGKGNNGGDGLVAARHLINRKHQVEIVMMADPGQLKADSLFNYKLIQKLEAKVSFVLFDGELEKLDAIFEKADILIDALFGVGLERPLNDLFANTIRRMNHSGKPILAVDIPSGLNADTGQPMGAAVKAARTATLALPKKGLLEEEGPNVTGRLEIIDIGIPPEIL